MNSKPNILYLQTDFPFPPTGGGRARAYYLLREMAKQFAVTLVSFQSPTAGTEGIREMERFCETVITIPFSRSNSLLKYLWGLVTGTPYKVLQYQSANFMDTVHNVVRQKQFDLIFSEHPYLAQYIPETQLPVLPQNIELMSNIYRRTASSGTLLMRFHGFLQFRLMSRYEIDLIRRYGSFIALTHEEEKFVQTSVPEVKSAYIPNGVDVDYFKPSEPLPSHMSDSVVFTGVFSYYPNEQGAIWFSEQVFPALRKSHPELRLSIVGKEPGNTLLKLNQIPGITVTGAVDDMRLFIGDASVVVAPLLVGGGTRLKILEAMAMGKAIVATKIGCEGLAVEHGKHLLIADSPEEFAASVSNLLENRDYANELGRNARELVEQLYQWGSIGTRLNAFLEAIISKSTPYKVQN